MGRDPKALVKHRNTKIDFRKHPFENDYLIYIVI